MSKSQVRFFQQNVQMLQIASDMMLFFASLIFQEAGRDLYLYSSSWKSLFPLPCTGFNRNRQKEVPQFPTLYLYSHNWCCWSSRVLFSSVHLKTPQVEEMSVVRFSHLIQAHKALVHGVSYGIHDHTISMHGTFQRTKQYKPETNSPVCAATWPVGSGGIH